MISLSTREYSDGWWVTIREWDGYDKPSHTRSFRITDVEKHLDDGRFKRKIAPIFERGMHKICIPIIGIECDAEQYINWIHENTTGHWIFDITDDTIIDDKIYDMAWIFCFKDDVDAMAFKLWWL